MGLNNTRQRSLLALALGSLLAATPAFAHDQMAEKAPKEPPTPEKIAEWKKEAEARPLFSAEAPVEIKLVGNYKVISKDRDTLLCYARCLATKGQFDEALALVDKAVELDPIEGDIWAQRSFLLKRKGDDEGAKQMLALAKEINPDGDYVDMMDLISRVGGGNDGN